MEEEDMISQLPDDILISIISLLPTKQALKTAILSKRWRNLFRYVSDVAFSCNLSICDRPFPFCKPCNSEAFINGVHGVLQRHSVFIRSFHLRSNCLPESCTQTFEQCILSLGCLGVQELNLRVTNRCYPLFQFSSHLLFLMPSLLYFKMSYGILEPTLKNPCNSLKTIWLCIVSIFPGSLEGILSNCLSLCTLTLERCITHSTLHFPKLNLPLKCMVILDCDGLEEIRFYAPNLTKFELECEKPVNLIFDYVPQLQCVHLTSLKNDVPFFCGKLETSLPSLNTLHLDSIGDLYQDGSIATGINMFSKLKLLELAVCDLKFNLFSLVQVVHGCPHLEEFQLVTWVKSFEWPEEEEQVKAHSRLKVVEMSGFGGSQCEFAFISYVLKNAVKLQQMIISWHIYMSKHVRYGKRETSYLPPLMGYYNERDKAYFRPPLPRGWKWGQVCECIHQMKHEAAAISNTLQIVTQEFPQKNCF